MEKPKKIMSALLAALILFAFCALPAGAINTDVLTGEEAAAEAAAPAAGQGVEILAEAGVLMDCTTGRVLLEKNMHEKLFPASVTKIMTMLLVTEAIESGSLKLADTVTASADAVSKGGSQIWLKQGETMTVDELFKAMAVGSANDASVALAEHIAGSELAFVQMMNQRAAELGMNDTHFENCTGLDDTTENHLTSAYDIALMSAELMKHEAFITKYTTIWMDSLRGGQTELVNTNRLVRTYEGITGLKTGTTNKAGSCLSATATREGTRLAAVVLCAKTSDDRFNSAKAMLNWGFANWSLVTPEIDLSRIGGVKILHGMQPAITPVCDPVPPVLISKGKKSGIKQTVTLPADIEAPIEKGQTVGKLTFTLDGVTLCECSLKAPVAVKKITFWDAFGMLIKAMGN